MRAPLAWLVAIAVVAPLVGASNGARATAITLEPASFTAPLSSSFAIAITITGLGDHEAPSLGVFDLDVSFDPSRLSYLGASFGDALLGDQLDLSGLGVSSSASPRLGVVDLFEVSFDALATLDELQEPAFTLAVVSFTAIAPGSALIDIALRSLGDATGSPIASDVSGAIVTIVPEPAPVLLVAAGLVGISMRRRHRRRAPCGFMLAVVVSLGIGSVTRAALIGDIDRDGDVDGDDLARILADRGKSVAESVCGAACDLDADGSITALDARVLTSHCSIAGCAKPAPVCGDGVVNPASEQCDGSADAACPHYCLADCTCLAPIELPEPVTIGILGGSYENPDDGIRVDVPPGAISAGSSAEISITRVSLDVVQELLEHLNLSLPDGIEVLGAYQLGLGDGSATPQLPVTVTLPAPGLASDTLIGQLLIEPTPVSGAADDRPPALIAGQAAVAGVDEISVDIDPKNFGSPPGTAILYAWFHDPFPTVELCSRYHFPETPCDIGGLVYSPFGEFPVDNCRVEAFPFGPGPPFLPPEDLPSSIEFFGAGAAEATRTCRPNDSCGCQSPGTFWFGPAPLGVGASYFVLAALCEHDGQYQYGLGAAPADNGYLRCDNGVIQDVTFPIQAPFCGDRFIDQPFEDCDDGNDDDTDGCDRYCAKEVCGNGVLQGSEQCDDGNAKNGDGCDDHCHYEPGKPLGEGEILVALRGSNQVVRIDPTTGRQSSLIAGDVIRRTNSPFFGVPGLAGLWFYEFGCDESALPSQRIIAAEPSGSVLLVSVDPNDVTADDCLRPILVRLDPLTRQRSVVTSLALGNELLGGPIAVAPGGPVLVADLGDYDDDQNFIQVDLSTGATTSIEAPPRSTSSIGGFSGLAVDSAGRLVLLEQEFERSSGTSEHIRLVRMDPASPGIWETIAQDEPYLLPRQYDDTAASRETSLGDVAIEADGRILVTSQAGLVRIDPDTGVQRLVRAARGSSVFDALAIERNGSILVADLGRSRILRIDPRTGTAGLLSADGFLASEAIYGIAVVPAQASGASVGQRIVGCGLGHELILVLPVLWRLRRATRASARERA